ncbi:MAG: helix-turn-helix domain-containing protein [Chloroflexi bacterium]|nr:helix-turn-helix domain-containing protein [Chloroflexota bacterium]
MVERFITVQEAAAQLEVHPQTVRVWLREGKLKGRLIGGRKSGYRIPASEIDRLLSPDGDSGSGDPASQC